MRETLLMALGIILSAGTAKAESGLQYALYPSPEIAYDLQEEIRLEFYGMEEAKCFTSNMTSDVWSEYITMTDSYGNLIPVKSCYPGGGGVTINFNKEEWDPGEYTLKVKEGIYTYHTSWSTQELCTPAVEVKYQLGGWIAVNNLSYVNPLDFMDIPTYDTREGSGKPYITQSSTNVGEYAGYSNGLLQFDIEAGMYTSGWFDLVVPANSIEWTGRNDNYEPVECGNIYTEQKVKVVAPLTGMLSIPSQNSKVVNPESINVWLVNLVKGICNFTAKGCKVYKDGNLISTLSSGANFSYSDYKIRFGFYWNQPGKYKVVIPGENVEYGIAEKTLSEDIVLEFEIIDEGSGVDEITSDEVTVPCEIYNLSGISVNGNLSPGIYIKKEGENISKIIVK